jgi:hypothetical protein
MGRYRRVKQEEKQKKRNKVKEKTDEDKLKLFRAETLLEN